MSSSSTSMMFPTNTTSRSTKQASLGSTGAEGVEGEQLDMFDDVCDDGSAPGMVDTVGWMTKRSYVAPSMNLGDDSTGLVRNKLGEGSMRFAIAHERSIDERIDDLFAHERSCFDAIKERWESMQGLTSNDACKNNKSRLGCSTPGWTFSNEMYLRFARFCNFDERAALKMMKECNVRYLRLKCSGDLEKQLQTKTLFIPPGLQTREGFDVFYMRPSRYKPTETTTDEIIDNLAYIMQVMMEKEQSCAQGIAFLANMADWNMSNFNMKYCLEFMKTLQGHYFPVDVQYFLIVDPPNWFGKIWEIMKKMMTQEFRKRVRMISSEELCIYLGDDYSCFLPDEMNVGKSHTDGIVSDFIAYRKFVESDISKWRKSLTVSRLSV